MSSGEMTEPWEPEAILVAIPDDAVDQLVSEGVATEPPTLRGPVLEAAITIGVDAAALVTLLQTPDTLQRLAHWIVSRRRRTGETLAISARQGDKTLRLEIDGEADMEAVADFLKQVLPRS